jgi:hypothetical protein
MRAVHRGVIVGTALITLAVTGCSSGVEGVGGVSPTSAPAQDYGVNMQRCLAEDGWDVEVTSDGGIAGGFPRDQSNRFIENHMACIRRFGYDLTPPHLTYEEASELYEALLDVADCMRQLGYHVSEPPSRHAYAERLASGGFAEWHPHQAVGFASPSDRERVAQECPHPR